MPQQPVAGPQPLLRASQLAPWPLNLLHIPCKAALQTGREEKESRKGRRRKEGVPLQEAPDPLTACCGDRTGAGKGDCTRPVPVEARALLPGSVLARSDLSVGRTYVRMERPQHAFHNCHPPVTLSLNSKGCDGPLPPTPTWASHLPTPRDSGSQPMPVAHCRAPQGPLEQAGIFIK